MVPPSHHPPRPPPPATRLLQHRTTHLPCPVVISTVWYRSNSRTHAVLPHITSVSVVSNLPLVRPSLFATLSSSLTGSPQKNIMHSITIGLTYTPSAPGPPINYTKHIWPGFGVVLGTNLVGLFVVMFRRDIVWCFAATWLCVSIWTERPKAVPINVRFPHTYSVILTHIQILR